MKDYRLSEMQAICEKMHNEFGKNACNLCDREVSEFCIKEFENCPSHWDDIEPRDMIELPYKDYVFDEEEQTDNWFVYYRSTEFKCVDCSYFDTEADADAFVNELLQKAQQLKGGK